ncbi:hypothetical protein GQ457_09G016620 [Hibiscus cannabinus]
MSKCECLHVSKIKGWKKSCNTLNWSKLSEGAKELLLENKDSLEDRPTSLSPLEYLPLVFLLPLITFQVLEFVTLITVAFDEIVSIRC